MESIVAGKSAARALPWVHPPHAPLGTAWLSAHRRPDAADSQRDVEALARPLRVVGARMRLRAVRRAGRVTDFMWESVSASAAPLLLYCDPSQLRGRCMREVSVGPLGHPALIERYRRVLEAGHAQSFEQVHRIGDTQVIVVHCVTGRPDGVCVTLEAGRKRADGPPGLR